MRLFSCQHKEWLDEQGFEHSYKLHASDVRIEYRSVDIYRFPGATSACHSTGSHLWQPAEAVAAPITRRYAPGLPRSRKRRAQRVGKNGRQARRRTRDTRESSPNLSIPVGGGCKSRPLSTG